MRAIQNVWTRERPNPVHFFTVSIQNPYLLSSAYCCMSPVVAGACRPTRRPAPHGGRVSPAAYSEPGLERFATPFRIPRCQSSARPLEPSTVIAVPSVTTRVASIAPLTKGMPNSRATIAACEKGPPTSVITALAILNRGVQTGVVACATSTSPAFKRWKSSGPVITRAIPRTRPGLPGTPTRIVRPWRTPMPRLTRGSPTTEARASFADHRATPGHRLGG